MVDSKYLETSWSHGESRHIQFSNPKITVLGDIRAVHINCLRWMRSSPHGTHVLAAITYPILMGCIQIGLHKPIGFMSMAVAFFGGLLIGYGIILGFIIGGALYYRMNHLRHLRRYDISEIKNGRIRFQGPRVGKGHADGTIVSKSLGIIIGFATFLIICVLENALYGFLTH